MVPDAGTIARRRHLMRTALRGVALLLLVMFVAPAVVTAVAFTVSFAGVDNIGRAVMGRAIEGVAFLLVGVGLLVFERRLVVWLVPMPRSRCPQCEYFLVSLVEPRCPECGLPLTAEFLDGAARTVAEQGQGVGVGRHG